MFRHVVMFKWNDDVDAAHIAATGAALDALVATIPEVGDYRHGRTWAHRRQLRLRDRRRVRVDRRLRHYRDHPDHQQVIADYIKGRVSARAAVQYDAG